MIENNEMISIRSAANMQTTPMTSGNIGGYRSDGANLYVVVLAHTPQATGGQLDEAAPD